MKPCDAARRILEVARPEKGGAPGFRAHHVLQALSLVASEPGIGRPRLQHVLGIGEAATRTLITRLVEAGLAAKAPRGVKPTSRGLEVVEALTSALREEPLIDVIAEEWGRGTAVILALTPPDTLTRVYEIRDYIVEEGCRTAVVGGLQRGSLILPGAPEYVRERVEQALASPLQGDATLIIVPERCRDSAVNAAIRIIAESCQPS